MIEPTKFARIKCGQIFISVNDIFSLICHFCLDDFHTLEEFRVHLAEHFPESPMNIKNEDSISIGSACDECNSSSHKDTRCDFANILQQDYHRSESTVDVAVEGIIRPILYEKDTIECEKSVKNEPNESGEVQAITEHTTNLTSSDEEPARRYKLRKRVVHVPWTINSFYDTDSDGRDYSNETKISKSIAASAGQECVNHAATTTTTQMNNKIKCKFCNKSFRSTRERMEHENTHTGHRPYVCRVCCKSFAAVSNLRKHLNRHAAPGEIQEKRVGRSNPKISRKCSFCGKICIGTRERYEHENIHTGKRPHACTICPQTFASSPNLLRHIKLHTDDRRHKCTVCKKRFVTKSKLEIHTKERHLKDTDPHRYFPCGQCDAKFKTYARMYVHRRIHRKNTAVFICYYCDKEFPRREYIARHMQNIHSGKNGRKRKN